MVTDDDKTIRSTYDVRELATPDEVRGVLEEVADAILARGLLRFDGGVFLSANACCILGAVAADRLGALAVYSWGELAWIQRVAAALRITEAAARAIAYGFAHSEHATAAGLTRGPWVRLGVDMRAAVDARAAFATRTAA